MSIEPQPDPMPNWDELKRNLAHRVKEIRQELYGENGGPLLAEALHVTFRCWLEYEEGVSIPGEVMLRFLELTNVNPRWLLAGQGPQYRDRHDTGDGATDD